MYPEIAMDHFLNPRNVGVIEDAEIIIQVGDPTCGDSLLLFLKIDNEVISDAKFRIKGCGAAIATSSMTTEMVKGKSLEEALALTDVEVADALGGLPDEKMHCSSLAVGAIHAGILRYISPPEEGAAEE
ncbi:MAG: iron-sulfur cluster assembly scaffold protein [Geobacteraceae bacterium]|nr:iron-sulfur cluster assembly scaffold protein [Geobacteraceae bacterium]